MTQDHPAAKLFCPLYLPEESGAAAECDYLLIFDRVTEAARAWAATVLNAGEEEAGDP